MFRTALLRSARSLSLKAQAPIARRAVPSAFLPVKIAAPSASIPSTRFYSASAGLGQDEVQGRILDLLKNFDKVGSTRIRSLVLALTQSQVNDASKVRN